MRKLANDNFKILSKTSRFAMYDGQECTENAVADNPTCYLIMQKDKSAQIHAKEMSFTRKPLTETSRVEQ